MNKRRYNKQLKKMQKNDESKDRECKAGTGSAHREVFVENSVRVDLSDNLEKRYETYSKEDKTHKGKELFWARFSVFLITIYAAITLLVYCANKEASDAAKSAADTAAKQLELTERPWVRVDLQVAGPLQIDKNGMNIIIQAVTKVSGNSPAESVIMESKLYVNYDWPARKIDEMRNAFCEDLKKRAAIDQKYLKSIFPGNQEPPEYPHLSVPKAELQDALKGGIGRVIPLVVTCVVYRSTFSETFYKTGYTSVIMQSPGMAVPGTEEITIPPERLFMVTETYTH